MTTTAKTAATTLVAGVSRDHKAAKVQGGGGQRPISLLLDADPRHVRGDSRMVITAIRQGRLPIETIKVLCQRAAKIAADTNSVRVFVAAVEVLTTAAEYLERLAAQESAG